MKRLTVLVVLAVLIGSGAGAARTSQNRVIDRIEVGASPAWLTFDPRNGNIYVANVFSGGQRFGDVSVIDGKTGSVVATVPFTTDQCAHPFGIGYVGRNSNEIYVACQQFTELGVIDARSNRLTGTIDVGSSPFGVAFDQRNGRVYVANAHDDDVSVIDPRTRTVVNMISLEEGPDSDESPFGLVYDHRDNRLFVPNTHANTVSIIDASTEKVIKVVPVGSAPQGVALDERRGLVYVTNFFDASVSVLDAATGAYLTTVAVGPFPFGLEWNPKNGEVYVANFGASTVSVIDGDTNGVVDTVEVGTSPVGVTVDRRSGLVYVTVAPNQFDRGSVAVIAPAR